MKTLKKQLTCIWGLMSLPRPNEYHIKDKELRYPASIAALPKLRKMTVASRSTDALEHTGTKPGVVMHG